jgi:hypothetical protein
MTEVRGPHLLPAHLYPLTMRFFDRTGREVHTIEVERPEGLSMLYIPPLAQRFGEVSCRIDFADGSYEDGT